MKQVSGKTPEDILQELLGEFGVEITEKTETRFACNCSKERMEKALISIGKKELEELIEDQGEAELTCQFCDNKYHFNKKELEDLLEKAKPAAQKEFAEIPPEEQPNNLTSTSGECMYEMLLYAYEHLNEFKLILCCSEGTRFSKLIDEMVEIETKGTHDYLAVLEKIGRPAPPIDERLEHILITGMFNTFFELIIHEMPLEEAKHYLKEMRDFYTAGWMKIMGQ